MGDHGQADVQHATFVSHEKEAKVVLSKVLKVFTAKRASFEFNPYDWEAIPTLHNVISPLAEIPVYNIPGGKVLEEVGIPDVSSARWID